MAESRPQSAFSVTRLFVILIHHASMIGIFTIHVDASVKYIHTGTKYVSIQCHVLLRVKTIHFGTMTSL